MTRIELRTVCYDGGELTYELEKKDVKNINLRLRRDGSVYASAPRRCAVARVDDFVRSKAKKLEAARRVLAEKQDNAAQCSECGEVESVMVLGKKLELRVEKGQKTCAVVCGDELLLTLRHVDDAGERAKAVEDFLSELCLKTLSEAFESACALFAPRLPQRPSLRIRPMTSRWGSCMPVKNVITLNSRLVFAPPECIEYVVLHEFTHFLHANHSKAFYAALEHYLPDWSERRRRLNDLL